MRATLALAFFCMAILFFALPLVATPVFSDSATGTIPCRNPAQPTQYVVNTFTGTSISGRCPDGAPSVSADAMGLAVSGALTGLEFAFSPLIAGYNAHASMQDMGINASGGPERFNIVLTTSLFGDLIAPQVDADLIVNGSTVWSAHRQGTHDPTEPFNFFPWKRTETFVVDVPITSLLSIQADISTSASSALDLGNDLASSFGSLSLTYDLTAVPELPVPVPEPGTGWSLLAALSVIAIKALRS